MKKINCESQEKIPFYPKRFTGGKMVPFSDVLKCLDSLGYKCLIEEKDYKGVDKRIPAICPNNHECTVHIGSLRKGSSCCRKCGVLRRRETSIKTYGVDHPMKSKKIKEKGNKTRLERYNVENALQVPEFKEKHRQTLLKRTGYDHPMKNPKTKEKAKQTRNNNNKLSSNK